MSDNLEEINESLKNISEYKESIKNVKGFINKLEEYKSEINKLNKNIDEINEKLHPFELVDFLYTKINNFAISDLKFVNKLIQQVKECKNSFLDNEEYLKKSIEIYDYLITEGINFIIKILNKSIDILYINNDFVIFTNLMENDIKIRQMILWHRIRECSKKSMWYKGDLHIFYRMMIKQECFVYSKLFYNDFLNVLQNLRSSKFSLFERFINSVFLPYFEYEIEDITINNYIININEFYKSVDEQDKLYNILLMKCYKEYSDNRVIDL